MDSTHGCGAWRQPISAMGLPAKDSGYASERMARTVLCHTGSSMAQKP